LTMARAAQVLNPEFLIVENVAPVQWDQTGVVRLATNALSASGYTVAGRVLDLSRVGVPQRRRRFVLLGSRVVGVEPQAILSSIIDCWGQHPPRTVEWAIRDLLDAEADSAFNAPSD